MSFCPLPVTTCELAWHALLSAVPPTHWIVSAVLPLPLSPPPALLPWWGHLHQHRNMLDTKQTSNCTSSSIFPHYCPEKPQITFLCQPTSGECLPSNYWSWSQMTATAVMACPLCAEVSSNSHPLSWFLFLFWFLLLSSRPQIPVLRTLLVLVDTPPLP